MAARNGRSTAPTSSSSSTLPYLLIFFLAPTCISALNITSILSSYPDLSRFSSLLSSSDVSDDLSSRTSLTILAVPNSHLHTSAAATSLSDVVRYHVLLRYLTWSDLRSLPPSGQLVPTLFQTTGRAPADLGSLNLTFNPSNGVVSIQPPNSPNLNPNPNFNSNSNSSSSATVLTLVRSIPYNVSIFTVSSLISPYGSDLVASELRPPSPGLNITKALIDGHGFNVAASMLSASGVIDEFEADEAGAGITLFVPTDAAFADLPPDVRLQALPADRKALVLKFHVLHSYYPLGSLESIVNPVQPTLATEANGAGSFTLNISKVNGSVALNSGVVQAVVTQTVFDQNPVSIFGISHVLLPREIFGELKGKGVNLGMRNSSGDDPVADPPEVGAAPLGTPTDPSSPPGLRDEIKSEAGMSVNQGSLALVFTVALLYLLLSV